MPYDVIAIALGFGLDLLLGDPPTWPHLVRWYGKVITWAEKWFYPIKNKHFGGFLLVIVTLLLGAGAPLVCRYGAYRLQPWCYTAIGAVLCWQCLAAKSLCAESGKVYNALQTGSLRHAQQAVAMIVGRDTDVLDEAGVTRAAVETVAENTSDGEVAPLFFMLLLGPAGGCLYKAVNTMDSMVGYRNERYARFGTCAARLDDAANYLPARLAALLMIAAAHLVGMDGKNAFRIWRRDRRNHASPNSAQTESVMAGALNIRLAGDAQYFGVIHHKPYIGDDIRPIQPEDILRSHRLLRITAWLMLLITLAGRCLLHAAL